MKALVGAFNQEKALVGAFSVIVQPVVEPMDRFTALPKTYAVREKFNLFLICWVEREKLLFLLLELEFDDAMNMENDNINNSL